MKTKIIIFLGALVILALIAIAYFAMFHDTDELMDEAKRILRKEASIEETEGRALHVYNSNKDKRYDDVVTVNVSLERVFVIHNFSDGYVFVVYNEEAYNASGKIKYGSLGATCFWKIHKENGKWDVVDVYEKPYKLGFKEFWAYIVDN